MRSTDGRWSRILASEDEEALHSGLAVWVLVFPAPVAATLPRLEVADSRARRMIRSRPNQPTGALEACRS